MESNSFLDGIDSSIIGFGGGFLFFVLYLIINWSYPYKAFLILIGVLLYFLSVGTGIALTTLGDRIGALIAGIGAPLVYFSIATIFFKNIKTEKTEATSNYDHLIDNNNPS